MFIKIKRCFLLVLVTLSAITLTGCFEEAKAKKIYNDSGLTNREKIDELEDLYFSSYKSHDSYNDSISDRAWDEIVKGNYDKAHNIMQGVKRPSGNNSAIYYAQILKEELPKPNKISIEIEDKGEGESLRWYYTIDYPELEYKIILHDFVADGYFDVEFRIYDELNECIDVHSNNEHEVWGHTYDEDSTWGKYLKEEYRNKPIFIEMTFKNQAFRSTFDYYKDSKSYVYTKKIIAKQGVYELDFDHIKEEK